nr:M1 family metallopeptidase [Prauserella flavalba]
MRRSAPAAGARTSGDAYLPEHGNGGYRVRHYDLELDYRIGANRLSGRARIDAVATQALSRFSLDLAGLKVGRVLVGGRPARYAHRGHKLAITPARSLADGEEFTVEVRYSGNPRPLASRYWDEIGWDELSDGVLVAAQPIGAPSWFPCDDHPSAKATYRVALTTASAYSVYVTGTPVSRQRSASTTTWVYEQHAPTATYLMSVQIGRYTELEPGPGQRLAVPPRLQARAEADFARQPRMLEVLADLFGPYPFAEYVVVVTDDDLDDPVEAQGMAVFGANHVDGGRTHERLVVHELAHQWFGNSLTVAGWRHIWLNEGFATYAEWLWSQASGGRPAGEHARYWRGVLAERPGLRLADPGVAGMFDEGVYKKGALLLHALRGELGDETFFGLLRAWTDTHRHATVTTEQFTALAARHAARPLDAFFTTWLEETALP